jgi:hypothetical protein
MRLAFADDATWLALPACLFAAMAPPFVEMGTDAWTGLKAGVLPAVTTTPGSLRVTSSSWSHVGLAMAVPATAMTKTFQKVKDALEAVVGLDDGDDVRAQTEAFAPAWRRFLMLTNLVQGAAVGHWRTTSAVQAIDDLDVSATHRTTASGWVGEIPDDLQPFALRLVEAGVPEPELLADVGPDRGANWGQAELCWANAKVAVLHPDYARGFNLEAARAAGWTVVVAGSEVDVASLCVAIGTDRVDQVQGDA